MDDHCVYHCPDHYYGSVEGEQSPSTSDGQLPHTDLSLHVVCYIYKWWNVSILACVPRKCMHILAADNSIVCFFFAD